MQPPLFSGQEHGEPQLSCDLLVDRAGMVVHNELVLSGWAVSPQRATGVLVDIDDRPLNASFGLDTPELLAAMPEMPGSDRAGYLLRVDTSDWEPGPRKITISVYDREENRSQITGEVTIRPFDPPGRTVEENLARIEDGRVAMWLDSPRILEGPCAFGESLEIYGWAHARDGIEAVTVTVDGRRQHEALRPIARPDLIGSYGENVAIDAGFVSRLLGVECPAGSHSVAIVAMGRRGDAVGLEGEVVFEPEGPDDDPMPTQIEWREGLPKPKRRGPVPEREAKPNPWEDRALLAEADAAESRAEARLVQAQQRSFARRWRDLESKAQGFDALESELALRDAELESAGSELEQLRAERDQQKAELWRAREEIQAAAPLPRELAEREAELENIKQSQSWRLTRPLRSAGRALRRLGSGRMGWISSRTRS